MSLISENPLCAGLPIRRGVCLDSTVFVQYQAVKLSGDNLYIPCTTADTNAMVEGICLVARKPGDSTTIPICPVNTPLPVPVLSDGSAVATSGNASLGYLSISATSAGRFTPGSSGILRVVGGAAAIADGVILAASIVGNSAGAGGGDMLLAGVQTNTGTKTFAASTAVITANLPFVKEQGSHSIGPNASTTADVAGDNMVLAAADAGAGDADGGTIDLIPGAPAGSGVYGGIGIGRTQSYSITVGKYTTTGTGRTVQTFLRGRVVNIDGGDDGSPGSGGVNITTDNDADITVDASGGVNIRADGENGIQLTSTGLVVGNGWTGNKGWTLETNGSGTGKLVADTGEIQIDSAAAAGVRIGTGAAGAVTTAIEVGTVGVSTLTGVGAWSLNGAIIEQHLTFKKGDGVTHTLSPQQTTTTNGNGARMNFYSGNADGSGDSGQVDIDTGTGGGRRDIFIGQSNAKETQIGRAGATAVILAGPLVKPLSDNTTALGSNTLRFASAWSVLYATDLGTPITAAATIAPDAAVCALSGATTIDTITAPVANFIGTVTFLCAAAVNFSTAGNVQTAVTVAADKAVSMTYDGSKWWPSVLA